MTSFQQHPDGFVYVRTDSGDYGDTDVNFIADFGSVLPGLPPGITERYYEPNVRHTLSSNGNVIGAGPMPFAYGDNAILEIADLIAAKYAREHPTPPPPTPDQLLAQYLAAGCQIVSAGGHPALTTTWSLDAQTQFEIAIVATSVNEFGFPNGLSTFTYPDHFGNPNTLTPSDVGLLFTTLRDYITNLKLVAATLNGGGSMPWPTQPVNVA